MSAILDELKGPLAVFSEDRRYRYTLWREWDFPSVQPSLIEQGFDGFKLLHDARDYVNWILLNPSTADETKDDPTIRKCIGFSKRWGYGRMCVTNLFAFRATDLKMMRGHGRPIGDENDRWLVSVARDAELVVAGWGCNGEFMARDEDVKKIIPGELLSLRKTKEGHPEHPLYVPYETEPTPL